MNRKQAPSTAKNAAGEAQQRVAELAGNKTDRTIGSAKKITGGLWDKPATLDQTLEKIDRKAR
jgi:uncharacterized protein YjbJ (UPF0337 family)